MKIAIGNITSDNNTVNKDFNAVYYFNDVKIKDAMEIINPTFIITTPLNMQVNYLYCEDLNRFYYIDNKTLLTGGRTELVCRVDVLKSFSNDILNLTVIIDKQRDVNKSNVYINDGSLVAESRTVITSKEFSNGFSENGNYILVVAGG